MGKWIGKNLAPLLVFSAAVLYFFGTLLLQQEASSCTLLFSYTRQAMPMWRLLAFTRYLHTSSVFCRY